MSRTFSLTTVAAFSLFSGLFGSEGHKVDPYPAPQAQAIDQDGHTFHLADVYQKYQKDFVLVYFYPKAGTPGCTAQACSLRDDYEELSKEGVHVIGVSTDSVASQKKFQDKNKLPFTLLADPEAKVVKAFGVSTIPLLGFSSRQAFLIKDGKVVWRDSKASTKEQAADVMKFLKEYRAS